jgi:hypothetical protein
MSKRTGRKLLGRYNVEGVFSKLVYNNENGIIGFISSGVDRGGQPSNEVYSDDLLGSLRYREYSEFAVGAVIPRFRPAIYIIISYSVLPLGTPVLLLLFTKETVP